MERKRIACVDGVTDGVIDATLSLDARGTPVKGAFVTIKSCNDLILGRMFKVDSKNVMHSNDMIAPYIMLNGKVPYWSGDVDVERAKIDVVSTVDSTTLNRIPWRRNPSSGTPVWDAQNEDLEPFVNEKTCMVTIGEIPNSNGVASSVVNRHFGACETGGYGEARHTLICGQNGSSKTVLASMLFSAKLAAYPEMGLLMPDTAGDLSDSSRHDRGDFRWNYMDVLKAAGIEIEVISIKDVRLSSKAALKRKLEIVLIDHISVNAEKSKTLADRVVEHLFDKEVTPNLLDAHNVGAAIVALIGSCYAVASRADKTRDAQDLIAPDVNGVRNIRRIQFEESLNRIRELFDGRWSIDRIIRPVLSNGKKVIIQMDETLVSKEDQSLIMEEVMSHLTYMAKIEWEKKGKKATCNAQVVLDEAMDWVPEGGGMSPDYGVSGTIKKAIRTTRKYGLGWVIIAQRPSGISKKVMSECHTKYFGRGLGIGADAEHLKNVLGDSGVDAYGQLSLQGGFFWVGIGLDNNIGTEGTYFTFRAFDGDATNKFIDANPHIFYDKTIQDKTV